MISFLQIIFTILLIRNRKLSHESLNWRNEWYSTYDFVVVGAGTAGSVVAARLAEEYNTTVLLIEAGGAQTVKSDIPAFTDKLTGSNLDWKYPIVSQKYAFRAYIGNRRNISRGKAFGGCSMHNDMNYYRENPEFFDFWTEISGVQNWKYSDVLPYFKKTENNLDENIVANSPTVHVTGGPLSVTTQLPDSILKEYIKASPGLGYSITYPDGREPFGSTIMQTTIKDGVRQSTSLIFLEGNRRQNLHILGQTLVTKILFNEKKRAVGLQFYRKERYHKVYARSEVIISAGCPGSSHLLMLSGVGSKYHLKELKIPIISDRKVGEFITTPFIVLNFDIKDQSSVKKPIKSFENYYKYFIEKRGPLAYKASGVTNFAQVHYNGRPELSHGCVLPRLGFIGNDLETLVKDLKMKEQWREYYRPYLNHSIFMVLVVLKRDREVRTIRLNSTNPMKYPLIDPCYLCNEEDVNDLVKTFKLALALFTSPVMSKVIKPFKHPIPGCSTCADQKFCDSYIRCYIQAITGVVYPMGGCRMGLANDSKAVVDQRLRVFGVSSLRVIDSSVLPVSTEQTNAITIMIGEYGADMVKEDNHME